MRVEDIRELKASVPRSCLLLFILTDISTRTSKGAAPSPERIKAPIICPGVFINICRNCEAKRMIKVPRYTGRRPNSSRMGQYGRRKSDRLSLLCVSGTRKTFARPRKDNCTAIPPFMTSEVVLSSSSTSTNTVETPSVIPPKRNV